MGRISATFKRLRWEKEAAFIPYVMTGYPSLEATRQIVPMMARQGADLIELGVPFSDPIADGPTIQRASQYALANGVTMAHCLAVAAEARLASDVPVVLMSYYNPVHRYGIERFAFDAAEAGVDGLIVPDLPPEEAGDLKAALDAVNVDLIFLAAPTSTDERLRQIAQMAKGFIYCVSVTGVTGARARLSDEVGDLVRRVRRHTDLPVVVGFGISTPEHVADIAQIADGVVVASALINHIEAMLGTLPEDEVLGGIAEFVREFKQATVRQA